MMFKNGMISIAAAAALFMTGCGDTTTEAAKTDDTHVLDKVTITIPVLVTDQAGNPMAKQTVVVDGKEYKTDTNGMVNTKASLVPDNNDTASISIANFDVTTEADDGTETTVSYLGDEDSTIKINTTDFTSGASIDNQVITDSNGAVAPLVPLKVTALSDSLNIHMEDSATEQPIASKEFIITRSNFSATVTSDANGDLNLTKFPTDTSYTYTFDVDGYNENTGVSFTADQREVVVDVQMTADTNSGDGDNAGPKYVDANNILIDDTDLAASSASWIDSSVTGLTDNPLVINFNETLSDSKIDGSTFTVSWAFADTAAIEAAQSAVDTAYGNIKTAVVGALKAREDYIVAYNDLKNYYALETEQATAGVTKDYSGTAISVTADNNTSGGDATFKTKWDAYRTALTAFKTSMDNLGGTPTVDLDGTVGADFTIGDVTIYDYNSTELSVGGASFGGATVANYLANAQTAQFNVGAQHEDLRLPSYANSTYGMAMSLANAQLTAVSTDWNSGTTDEVITATATATVSGKSVSLVTSEELPSANTSEDVYLKIDMNRLDIRDSAGNIMQTTGTTGSTLKRTIYLRITQ